MPSSFLVYSKTDLLPSILIEKFHLNLWEIDNNYLRMDIGLLFKVKKDEFFQNKDLIIELKSPFPIFSDSLKSVYNILQNDNNINLIFNENCTSIISAGENRELDYSKLIKFEDINECFILINPILKVIDDEKNTIKIEFDSKKINKDLLTDIFKFYVRFSFQINIKECDNITRKSSFTNEIIYYDFRLNELRLFDTNELSDKYKNIIKIEKLYIFVITEILYKPRLIEGSSFTYRRLLENDLFKKYVLELKATKKQYIVNFWKLKLESKNESKNLVVSFEKEKEKKKVLITAIITNLIASIIFYFTNENIEIASILFSLLIMTFIFLLIYLIYRIILWFRCRKIIKTCI